MPNPTFKKILNSFNLQVIQEFNLIKSIERVRKIHINFKCQLSQNELYEIVELSFIRIFIAWEQFLEDMFTRHLISQKKSKIKSYVSAKSLKHAYEIVKENKPYPDWTNKDVVLRKANLFFKEGEPYMTALNSISSYLEEIKTIRNSIVHMSTNSQENFKSLVRIKMASSPRGISAGKFLLSIKNPPAETYIEYYANILKSSARLISNF